MNPDAPKAPPPKRVALLLAEGFEEAEAIIVLDVLRRLNIDVHTLACDNERLVVSYHAVPMICDDILQTCSDTLFDAVVLPGGPSGARNLGSNPAVVEFVRRHIAASRLICSICSAAAHVLAANDLLGSRRYVCSGDNHKLYDDGVYVDRSIIKDGPFVSCQGLGVAFEFALTVASLLTDPLAVTEHAEHIYVSQWPAFQAELLGKSYWTEI